MAFGRDPAERGTPLEDCGEDLVRTMLDEIEEEERLSAALGVDLTPPGPNASHAPPVYLKLEDWVERSEEIHRFLREQRLAHRSR